MEYRLSSTEAVRMFEVWCRELEASPGRRAVEGGDIRLDSVPSARGAEHRMNGSVVEAWYKAANPPSERALREAAAATRELQLPRQRYSGRLIDIKRARDGTVYFLLRAVERRDESNNGMPAYRAINPSKGTLISLCINPAQAAESNHRAARSRGASNGLHAQAG
ncbi:MAG: hypothetical protein SF051_05385 [Elusimicrobiota bacterium]|nr:hypothetical protein [Elusimicrobiota bacterium]